MHISLTQRLALQPGFAALASMALHALALWPHLRFAWQRLHDGSDDPLGVVAAAALVAIVVARRVSLRHAPRLPWMVAALVGTLAANAALAFVPPLAAAVLAALAFACGLAAWLPEGAARAPLAGLAVLALPLIASLQFYAGYPLRVITAQVSAWLLQLGGVEALRSGASMTVRGQLVVVDAPCSGVQMVWFAYFTACSFAAFEGHRDGAFLRRLPLVGALVMCANIARNSVLVTLESRPQGLSASAHEAIGLLALLLLCAAVVMVMRGGRAKGAVFRRRANGSTTDARDDGSDALVPTSALRLTAPHWILERGAPAHRPWLPVASAAPVMTAGVALVVAALLPFSAASGAAPAAAPQHVEWPHAWDGHPIRPLALSAVEARFAKQFPGVVGRFTDGHRVFVMRHVTQPTRMLHPAVDCFRATGYRIGATRLEHDAQQRLWRCFEADRSGERVRVCERIERIERRPGDEASADAASDAMDREASAAFVDTSSWFWAAALGTSRGPWRAVTKVEAL
jgi:exosortase/archaeosortase family protein